MGMTKVSKYAAATVTTFFVASCAVLYFSANSDFAPIRGDLPPANNGRWVEEVEIEEFSVPLSNFTETLFEPEQEPEHEPDIAPDPYEAFEADAREILATMTDEEKLYQLFIVTPEGLMPDFTTVSAAGESTRAAIEAKPVGGIIYLKQNLVNASQTEKMLAGVQSYSKIPLFLGVDEEGGTVSRISSQPAMGFEKIPAMAEIGATGDASLAYETGAYIGQMLGSLGFNLDFAPVADVLINPDNEVIASRAFGSEPELVASMTESITRGLRDYGIAATLKHFPGQGNTTDDTHDGRSVSERTLEEMRETEFISFASGIDAGADLVMLAHISAVNIDAGDIPASMSPEIIELLRTELGFKRVIITDALDMGAITKVYDSGEAAVQAISAGVDILLMPKNLTEAVQGLRDALETGRLTWQQIDESLVRILTVKLERGIMVW